MVKKIFVSYLLIGMMIITFLMNICQAVQLSITEQDFKNAIQEFSLSEDFKDVEITIDDDNNINVLNEEQHYTFKYEWMSNPVFYDEIIIERGINIWSDEFDAKEEELNSVLWGYCIIAKMHNINLESSLLYILASWLENLQQEGANEIIKIEDHYEYLKESYEKPQIISDSKGCNTYSLTIEKEDISEDSFKVKYNLKVNLEGDFSKTLEYVDKTTNSWMGEEITEDNADYVIKLKVGQICKIKSNSKVTGHEMYRIDIAEINEEYTEIIAKKAGIAKGILDIGEKKKSIYIIVEENTENKEFEPITLDINIIEDNKEDSKETVNLEKLPNTGNDNAFVNALYIIIGLCSICVIALIYNLNKRK